LSVGGKSPDRAGGFAGGRAGFAIHKLLLGARRPARRGFEPTSQRLFCARKSIAIVNTTLPDPQGGAPLPALRLNVDLTVGRTSASLLLNSTAAVNAVSHSFCCRRACRHERRYDRDPAPAPVSILSAYKSMVRKARSISIRPASLSAQQ
jgi:hypothetical protein